MSVINPAILQFGRVEPYLSLIELTTAPTASMLDFSNFIESGDQDDQNAAMEQLIVRASSKVDVHCMGRLGTLNATSNLEPGQYRPDRYGRFTIRPYYTPVIAVTSFEYGPTPGMGNVLEVTTDNCWPEREQFVIAALASSGTTYYAGISALSSILYANNSAGGSMYCQWTYVNGWANTFSSSLTDAASTTMDVNDATGIYPGMQLTIWDGVSDETVTIASDYVAGDLTLSFVSPTLYSHVSGTNISALPAAVKQAVIHFVVSMVRERGEGGFVVEQMGESASAAPGRKGMSDDDEIAAYDLLEPFVQTSGRI